MEWKKEKQASRCGVRLTEWLITVKTEWNEELNK